MSPPSRAAPLHNFQQFYDFTTHSGTLLVLNELGEADPATIGETIYALTNGQRKRRHHASSRRNSPETWCLCTLSSGEITLAERIAEGGGKFMGGHEVRLLQIRADRQRHGVFDHLHQVESPATFAEEIKRRATKHYGTAGPAFVKDLIRILDSPHARVKLVQQLDAVAKKLVADSQLRRGPKIQRAARLFGAISVAGELATSVGLTGWTKGAVLTAVSQVVPLWEVEADSFGAGEIAAAARRVGEFIADNPTRFGSLENSSALSTGADAGWVDKDRVYFPPKVWEQIHIGYDDRHIAREMFRLGMRVSNNGTGLTWRISSSVSGRPHVYAIDRTRLDRALRADAA